MEEFAEKLIRYRESLNLTIQQVSEKTKIRPHILLELENGHFTFLPAVYIISFIKTYATFLKIPDDEIEYLIESLKSKSNLKKPAQYQSIQADTKSVLNEYQPPVMPVTPKKIGSLKNSNIINYLIYSALGLTIVVLIYITFFMDGSEKRKFSGEKESLGPDTAIIKNQNKAIDMNLSSQDSILLEAVGKDTAWIRIIIDGQKMDQFTIYPEMEKKWFAKEYFLLSIGNEGAVIFKRNGMQLQQFGTKGTIIRNIKITRDKVDIPSAPWSGKSDSTIIRKPRGKKPEEKKPVIRLIDPSPINNQKPKIKN